MTVSHETPEARELVTVTVETATVGVASCEDCGFHRDAMDVADVPRLQSDSFMHATSMGHTVNEHLSRSMTLRPVP